MSATSRAAADSVWHTRAFSLRQPASLLCGHSFCAGCLAGVDKRAGCPTCRAPWCEHGLRAAMRKHTRHTLPSCAERRALPPLTRFRRGRRAARRAADFAPRPNFVVRALVDGLTVCCRFGVREGAAGAWEPAPLGDDDASSAACPRVLRLDAVAAHEATCDFALAPCPYAGCGALLRPSEVAAHDALAAGAHAVAERAARLASDARADDTQRRLDKLAPYAVDALEEYMDDDDFSFAVENVVKLMTLHASSAAVAGKGCSVLAAITQCAFDAGVDDITDFLRHGAVEALVAALRKHGAAVPRVAEQACEALANMMDDVNAARKAAQQGVVAVLLAALSTHAHNPGMQQAGLRLLASLAPAEADEEASLSPDAAVVRALKAGGATARIFAAMRAHLAYESLQHWAKKALCGLQPLDAMAAATAAALLEVMLAAHSTNAPLLTLGFTLLHGCLAANSRVVASGEAAAALAGVIVDSLRAAPADVRLQRSGVAALAELCAAGHALAVLHAGAAVATGAAAVTAAAMRAQPAVEDVQHAGFRVLTSFASRGASGALAAGDADCLARIVAAMAARAADAETQRLGAHALSCICDNALAFRADAPIAAQVVAVLTAALSAFGGADVAVASAALRACTFVDTSALAAALPAVLDTMTSHAACAALQRDGCLLLWRTGAAAATSSHCATQLDAHAAAHARVHAIVAALRAHGAADAALAAVALAALKTLANANGTVSALAAAAAAAVDAGGVEAVLGALRAHPSVMDVQRYGCWTLSHLCDGSATKARARAKDAGGAKLVAAALAAFPDSAVVIHAKAAQRLLLR
jgi:hypothetical protein